MTALGHAHFQPKDLPRQFRLRIIEQLGFEAPLARIMTIDRGEKSQIVTAIRTFLGITPVSQEEKAHVRYLTTLTVDAHPTIDRAKIVQN